MQFKDVIGLQIAKEALIRNAQSGRISHSQLFIGADGGGALTLALAFASYLFCENPNEEDSCGTCSNCLKTGKLIHPDLHFTFPFISGSKNDSSKDFLTDFRAAIIKNPYLDYPDWLTAIEGETKQAIINKEEGRAILQRNSLKSYEGSYKINIIWKPELLHTSAANALLKIIEEPPAKTLFFFVSDKSDEILPTILSRTQLVRVGPVNYDDLATALQTKFGLDEAQAHSLAASSEGNYAEAAKQLQKTDQDAATFENFRMWMRHCYQRNVVGLTAWVDETSKLGRERLKQFIHYGLFIARQCMLKHYLGEEQISLRGEEREFVLKFSPFINERNIVELTTKLDEAYRDIARNGNPKLVLLDLSFSTIVLLKK